MEAVLQIETHRFGRHQLFDELVSERHISAVSADDHDSMPCAHISDLNLRARRSLELGYDPTLGAKDGALCQSQRESEACYHKKRAAGASSGVNEKEVRRMRRTTSPLRTFNSRVIILARSRDRAPACSRGRNRADTNEHDSNQTACDAEFST